MKRVEVKLSLQVVVPLLDVIKAAGDSMKGQLAVAPGMQELEPEFRGMWTDELLAAQNDDVKTLLGLFDSSFFSTGVIGFDEKNAEGVVRACSSVRLRLRSGLLAGVDDDRLESGDVELGQLDETVRKAFMGYLFLATIQELIIQHLDSSIIGS